MKKFGLIGYPVSHSFSKEYFKRKFEDLALQDHTYDLFEMEHIADFPSLWLRDKDLVGVNVTVPHKQSVLKYLDQQDLSAVKVGAANVVFRKGNKLIGYNTDYLAFKNSLKKWIGSFKGEALILGSGGASKAVQAALADLNIPYNLVSRTKSGADYTYRDFHENSAAFLRFKLIVNTTPLGMFPKIETFPDLPYQLMSSDTFLYDLVYNPAETKFLTLGRERGARIKNGLEMLELQAEESWSIWNS